MKITTAQHLSSVLKESRTANKLSQSEVAKRVGMRQDTVSNFEKYPESTRLETLFKLLSALDLELEVHPRDRKSQADDWQEEW